VVKVGHLCLKDQTHCRAEQGFYKTAKDGPFSMPLLFEWSLADVTLHRQRLMLLDHVQLPPFHDAYASRTPLSHHPYLRTTPNIILLWQQASGPLDLEMTTLMRRIGALYNKYHGYQLVSSSICPSITYVCY